MISTKIKSVQVFIIAFFILLFYRLLLEYCRYLLFLNNKVVLIIEANQIIVIVQKLHNRHSHQLKSVKILQSMMFRSFNLLKLELNNIKLGLTQKKINFDSIQNACVHKNPAHLKNTFLFSSSKQDLSDQKEKDKYQNPIIKQVTQQEDTQKYKEKILSKTKRRSSKKSSQIIAAFEKQIYKPEEITNIKEVELKQSTRNQKRSFYNILFADEKQQKTHQIQQTNDFYHFLQQEHLQSLKQVQKSKRMKQKKQRERGLMKEEKSLKKEDRIVKREGNILETGDKRDDRIIKRKERGVKYQENIIKKEVKSKNLPKPLFQGGSSSQISIITLKDILNEVSASLGSPRIQEFEKEFFYVLDLESRKQPLVSFGFRYYLLRFCKFQIYFRQHYSPQELLSFELKCVETVRFYCLQPKAQAESNDKRLPDARIKYMQQFMTNLLPFENTHIFADIYLQVGIEYMKVLKSMQSAKDSGQQLISVNSLNMIQVNLKRLLFNDMQGFQVDDAKEEDYTLYRAFFTQFLDLYCVQKYKFQTADRIDCVQIAKFLKVPHPQFMQFVKQMIQTAQQNYSTVQFLSLLGYLVQNKNTPYQYFYKHKQTWMKIIQSSHDLSAKKTKCCIKFLEIFSRQRFVHCEKIYFRLLESIQNNLEAMEGKQLVRTLYYYSRARYGSNAVFVSRLVEKTSRWLPYLEEKHFSLLVRSIGNLNYQSEELVEKLKNINYQRFLNQLKFGCEKLGSYYQEILKQVQAQSRGKNYYQGEQQLVIPSIVAEQATVQNLSV